MSRAHCFFTSFNRAYAFQALTLAQSLRAQYGDGAHLVALLVDELTQDDYRTLKSEFDEIICADALEIPRFRQWIFRLDIIEAATAVKPFALCHLLDRFEKVTYLDPDIRLYSRLVEIDDSSDYSVALTPHQIEPQDEAWLVESTELESFRFGIYNLGFASFNRNPEGIKAAQWWRDRCYLYCTSSPQIGIFTDQKFWDIAPAYFPSVRIIRHPGYNVATWNLRERTLAFDLEQGPTVNGAPLRFCHFTKATHAGSVALERMSSSRTCFFYELFFSYIATLDQWKADLRSMSTAWAYGRYTDGRPILQEDRHFQRLEQRWMSDGSDPFARSPASA
jgi:hypothetical protein